MSGILKYSLILLGVICILFLITRTGVFSGKRPVNLGVISGKLISCPETPNCVSTQADDELHSIAPLAMRMSIDLAQERLLSLLAGLPRTNIVMNNPGYVYVEFQTGIMLYTDDVEFWFDENAGVIHFRSASRLGTSDLGLNRRRMELIRTLFTTVD